MIATELVATLATTLAFSLSSPQADTLDGIRRANRLIRDHYGARILEFPSSGNPRGGSMDAVCDGGAGDVCHGGDPDRGYCPLNAPCHRTEEWLVRGLLEEATRYPSSGFLTGQAVYALTKFGYITEAAGVVEGCRAEAWWCDALRGYLLYAQGQMAEAEVSFRRALEGQDTAAACAWGDGLWLLGEWDQRTAGMEVLPRSRGATAGWTCQQRLAASDTLFWYGDPLFSDEVNDRWTEHIARAVAAELYSQIQGVRRGGEVPRRHRDHDWAMRIRRGPWDSYDRLPGMSPRFWTSDEAAAYRFIPEVDPSDLSRPIWQLGGDLLHEGYTPDYGPLLPLPVQVARFRAPGALRVAAAASLADTPLRRATSATAHLVLSDGPGSFPLKVTREVRRETPTFLEEAEPRDYVVGFEAFTRVGIGWHRALISPLTREGPELSDLLLHDPSEGAEAASLQEAAGTMLGSTTLKGPGEVGVFWEVYGAPAGGTLELELALEREAGGVVDRITALLPGGSQEGRGRVAWTEPAAGETHPRGITLNLAGMEAGGYALILRVRWPGQAPLERRRRLVVE